MAAVVGTALVVNARHLMYSAALAPTFQSQPRWFRWLGPYLLIDQLFALTTVRPEGRAGWPQLLRGCRNHLLDPVARRRRLWASAWPRSARGWNFEFAIPLLFIGLLVLGIEHWPEMVAHLAGAGITYLAAGLPNRTGLLVGAFVGMIAGFIAERLRRE